MSDVREAALARLGKMRPLKVSFHFDAAGAMRLLERLEALAAEGAFSEQATRAFRHFGAGALFECYQYPARGAGGVSILVGMRASAFLCEALPGYDRDLLPVSPKGGVPA